jgi:histidine triad (HIT) family protein
VKFVHEPPGYECPFCGLLCGVETKNNALADVVWRDELTCAFISPKWWAGNEGHAIVIPVEHVENVYTIDPGLLRAVYEQAQRVTVAMRESYRCPGTSMRQHNEPAAGQDVWHFHVHVFPRWPGDRLYANDDDVAWTTPDQRAPYAEKLRAALRLTLPRSARQVGV